MVTGGVVLTHPVHQHAYEVAVAAQQAGLLNAFVTGLYWKGRGMATASASEPQGGPLRRRLHRTLGRRWHPDLDPRDVVTISRYHLIELGLRPLVPAGTFRRALLEGWAHEHFDRATARWLAERADARLVHGFEGYSLHTLRQAKRMGLPTVLDVASPHEYYRRVLEETGCDVRTVGTEGVQLERSYADILLVPSQVVRQCLVEHGVDPARIVEVPYGIDAQRFRPNTVVSADRPLRVLYVGRSSLLKGIDVLLTAWQSLGPSNAELVCVGPLDAEQRRLARSFPGLARFVGSVSKADVHHWYRLSDIFVLPSRAEAWGLVVSEAMASGLPVIVTDKVGAPVREGVDGYVVPAGNAAALTERIAHLLRSSEDRTRLGAAGRQEVLSKYTVEHYRRHIASTYNSILDQPLGPGAIRARP